MSPPKRGGRPRCVLRAFVCGLARGPRGEPPPPGGYHIVEFDGTPFTSTVFLRTYED